MEWKKYLNHIGLFMLSALFSVLFITGCAEKGPILLDIAYQTPAGNAEAVLKTTVAVSPLKDSRGKPSSVLGRRTVPSGLENDFVVQGTVSEAATDALKKALTRRGFAVKDVPGWDLTVEGMKAEGSAILLGGEITAFWLESVSVPFKTNLKVSVQFKIVAGDSAAKKIIRTIDVSSKLEQDILYSREKLEESLSEALTSAVDQIFKDDELKKRLQ